MTDVWTNFNDLDSQMQQRLAEVLETRGSASSQQAMRQAFLSQIEFPKRARVLDVGCGTGTLTRLLGRWPDVASVTGVDPATHLIDRARSLARGLDHVDFREAKGGSLPFDVPAFDVVTFDSVLSHIDDPERALGEALRVLRPGGQLGIFDGDYSTTTVAIGEHDPLQPCVDAMMASSVNDRWIVRRLPALVRRLGFEVIGLRSHGFVDDSDATYMLTVVDRGVEILRTAGRIADATAAALKAEARHRVERGSFFGHIAYASLTARRPIA
ncbi:MAG: class I SAM-dependent methyltransferase [Kofleriaceae bacterium]